MSARAKLPKNRGTALSKQGQSFASNKFRTRNSAWTPLVNRPSNDQIFKERTDLICHWFDLWTDVQRKRFMKRILGKCSGMKILFNVKLAKEPVLIEHLDFVTVLPRFLCLYILSFLDPRTLCRAAQVCWYWKFLNEQDCLWMPKCVGQGWYLPYLASDLEHGAWKKHYIHCTGSLDLDIVDDTQCPTELDYQDVCLPLESREWLPSPRRLRVMTTEASQRMMKLRPPWMVTRKNPNDIDLGTRAVMQGFNPNERRVSKVDVTFHDKFGTLRSEPIGNELQGTNSVHVKDNRISKQQGRVDDNPGVSSKKLLSECSLQRDYSVKDRMTSLKTQSWLFESSKFQQPLEKTSMWSFGTKHNLPNDTANEWQGDFYLSHSSPRILLISSNVPAYELLVDAAVFGVIPLVYEYEGSTPLTILNQLATALQGRIAECIGLFTDYVEPGEIRLCRGTTISSAAPELSFEMQQFFETLSLHALPAMQQGHIDIFLPLPSTDEGLQLLSMVEDLTRGKTRFLSPFGLSANLKNQVASEWSGSSMQVEPISPPKLYFNQYKLDAWTCVANYIQEAMSTTRSVMADYFENQHKDVMNKVAGHLMFDLLGLRKLQDLHKVAHYMMQAFVDVENEKNVSTLEYVSSYLLRASGLEKQADGDYRPETPRSVETLQAMHQQYSQYTLASVAEVRSSDNGDTKSYLAAEPHKELVGRGGAENEEAAHNNEVKECDSIQRDDCVSDSSGKAGDFLENSAGVSPADSFASAGPLSPLARPEAQLFQSHFILGSSLPAPISSPRRLPLDMSTDQLDLHKTTAQTILQSELEYRNCLRIVRDNFVIPLKRAIQSNRAIIGTGNLHTMFADLMVLLDVSDELARELNDRLREWSSSRFLGDIFVKFCTKLTAFVNYVHNYPTILQIVKKNIEQYPQFRGFVARRERTFATKMLSLHELIMIPFGRIQEYVTLLQIFKCHTASDHGDRSMIANAVTHIKDVHRIVKETQSRMLLMRKLDGVQKKIDDCPHLAEPGRHFLMQQDFAVLKPVDTSGAKIVDKYKMYCHEEDVGLFLFNDALVVTACFFHLIPFQRAVAHEYQFFRSIGLSGVIIEDILDSKFVKNSFRLKGARHEWILAASAYEKKFDFLTALESAIKAQALRGIA